MTTSIHIYLLLFLIVCISTLNAGINEDIAYQTEIQVTFLDNGRQRECYATIIGERYVITAASCFTDISPSLFLTESDYDFKVICNGEEYLVDALQRHENYLVSTKANNLALIKVNRDFPITGADVVNGIRNFDLNELSSENDVEMIGFMTNKSPSGEQKGCSVSGEVLTQAACTSKVRSVDTSKLKYLNAPNICFEPDSIRGCDFTKGAALVGDSIVFGVLSEYPNTCLRGSNCLPFIFTPLFNYTDWLDKKLTY